MAFTKGDLRKVLELALSYLRNYRDGDMTADELVDNLIEDLELLLYPSPSAPVGRPRKEDAP